MLKIGVLLSGGGSNFQSILDNINSGYLNNSEVVCVVSDRHGAFGLERAKQNNINNYLFDRKVYKDTLSDEILNVMQKHNVDVIVLAGYLSILKGAILDKYSNSIINIHPSLIPSFCGMGMHGIKVHEKAIASGVKVSGCTVHFVDEGTDTGHIILQKVVKVYCTDEPSILQKRILVEEHKALPEALKLIQDGKVKVLNNKVYIEGEGEL